jgi:hypothetical protein
MLQGYWIYIAVPTGEKGFTIVLKPFHFRRKPIHIKIFAFVNQRRFASARRAKQAAESLFGTLRWHQTGTQQRAAVKLSSTPA